MNRHSAQASATTFAARALQSLGRNLNVMLDVATSSREVVRNVRAMQAMLREADACEASDAARAARLRRTAGSLIS